MRFCESELNRLTMSQNADPDFLSFGTDLLNDEELTDAAYSSMISLICKGFEGSTPKFAHISDIGKILLNGFYLPGSERISLLGGIQKSLDFAYGLGTIYHPEHKEFHAISLENNLPRGMSCAFRGENIKLTVASGKSSEYSGGLMKFYNFYGRSRPDGNIVACHDMDSFPNAKYSAWVSMSIAGAISAIADSRYLWIASASENLIGTLDTRIRIGLNKEQIKSVFYARSLPVTDTGRKRPILHLVRSHQRRIKEGIDIDIDRHVRGIDSVDIAGMTFNIRPPKNDSDLHSRWK